MLVKPKTKPVRHKVDIFKKTRELKNFKSTKIYHVKVPGAPEFDLIFDTKKQAEAQKKLLKQSHRRLTSNIEPIIVLHELLDGYMLPDKEVK